MEGENKQEAKIILLDGAGFHSRMGNILGKWEFFKWEGEFYKKGFELGFPTKENFHQKNA